VIWWRNFITVEAVAGSENEICQSHFIFGMYVRTYVCMYGYREVSLSSCVVSVLCTNMCSYT